MYLGNDEFDQKTLDRMRDCMLDYEAKTSNGAIPGIKQSFFDENLKLTHVWQNCPYIIRFIWEDTKEGYDYWRQKFMLHAEKYAQLGIHIPGCEAYNTIKIGGEVFNI